MNPDVTDTEFVHFEVVAARPRRRRARWPLALLALGLVAAAFVAVMRLRARAQSNAGRRRPGNRARGPACGRRDCADTGLLTN